MVRGGLAAGLLLIVAGCSAPATSPAPRASAHGDLGSTAVAPVVDSGTGGGATTAGAGGGTTAGGGAATTAGGAPAGFGTGIAFPYPGYAGGLGVAPEGTILVVGTGRAPVKADGSDRDAAVKKATAAALADGRSQADRIAGAMGVRVTTVYSVSVATSENYTYPETPGCVTPPARGASATDAPEATGMPNATGGITRPALPPEICGLPQPVPPAATEVFVTATVVYRFS